MVALHIGRYERPVVYAGTVALAAGAYYLAGRIGLELAYLDGAVAALWPPAGSAWRCCSCSGCGCGPRS